MLPCGLRDRAVGSDVSRPTVLFARDFIALRIVCLAARPGGHFASFFASAIAADQPFDLKKALTLARSWVAETTHPRRAAGSTASRGLRRRLYQTDGPGH